MPESTLLFTFKIFEMYSGFATANPNLHPAMLKLLLREFNSIQISLAPLTFIMLNGLSFKMKLYGLSFTIKILLDFAKFIISEKYSWDATAPVGI